MKKRAMTMGMGLFLVGTMGIAFGTPYVGSGPAEKPAVCAQEPVQVAARTKRPQVFRVLKKDLSRAALVNGQKKQSGRMQIQLWKGRKAHDLNVEVSRVVTKGDGDVTVSIQDTTANATSIFKLNDQTGLGSVSAGGGAVDVKFNPDGSVTVAGTVYKDAGAGGAALATNATGKAVTPESYAAVIDLRGDTSASTGKDVVGAFGDIAGLFAEAALNGLLGICGCTNSGWIWDWTCAGC